MLPLLVISAFLVGLGAAAPATNISQPLGFLSITDLRKMDNKQLEETFKTRAKARVGYTGSEHPYYASCDIDWTFGVDCVEVSIILTKQIKKWTGDVCGSSDPTGNHDPGKQDCMYQYFYGDETFLYAMHQTPDMKHLDLFVMFFDTMPYGCYAWSYSYTADIDEIFDEGRNFCNVNNLVDGCGLSAQPAYSRDSSDYRCTHFTSQSSCGLY